MTRQRRWQLAQIAAGRCSKCGRARRHYATLCDPCRRAETARARPHYQRYKVARVRAALARAAQ